MHEAVRTRAGARRRLTSRVAGVAIAAVLGLVVVPGGASADPGDDRLSAAERAADTAAADVGRILEQVGAARAAVDKAHAEAETARAEYEVRAEGYDVPRQPRRPLRRPPDARWVHWLPGVRTSRPSPAAVTSTAAPPRACRRCSRRGTRRRCSSGPRSSTPSARAGPTQSSASARRSDGLRTPRPRLATRSRRRRRRRARPPPDCAWSRQMEADARRQAADFQAPGHHAGPAGAGAEFGGCAAGAARGRRAAGGGESRGRPAPPPSAPAAQVLRIRESAARGHPAGVRWP